MSAGFRGWLVVVVVLATASAQYYPIDISGYLDPVAQAAQPEQIKPKPRIPTLVYYGPRQAAAMTEIKEDEAGFNYGMTSDRMAEKDVPDSFQYRINCGEDVISTDKLWIPDARIPDTISRTTCKTLLEVDFIKLKTYPAEQTARNIRLIPVPALQTWNSVQLQQSRTGIDRNRISSCCDREQCTSICLEFPAAQQCHLEIYTVGQGQVYAEGIGADVARIFSGGVSQTTIGGAFLHSRFRVPCDYCPLTNCITNCTNGQYATGYSDIVVRHTLDCLVGCKLTMILCATQSGLQANKVECKPCAPGTWNTCQLKDSCSW